MTDRKGKVLAASLTPLGPDSTIDVNRFASHIGWLLESGCDGALLFGTTGEGNSFSVRERKEALEGILNLGVPASKLMVATGCCALPDTTELTTHALTHAVDSVLVLPPFYYKTASEQGIHDTFARLIDSVDDARLRLYLYHFPKMAIVAFSVDLIEKLIASYPECIAGIKDSTGDKLHTEMLNERFPSLEVFAGSEMFLLDYLHRGGAGCISATANITASLAAQVRDHRDSPDAERLQLRLSTVRSVFEQFPLTGALKGLLALELAQPDWANIREPLACLAHDKVAELSLALADVDYRINYAA